MDKLVVLIDGFNTWVGKAFALRGFGWGLASDLTVSRTFFVMSNDVLLPVALFNFMGYVVERSGILVAVNLQTAFLSPPVAMAAFYLKGVSPPSVLLSEIYWGMMPFMILQGVGLAIVFFFPQIALWIPKLLFGGYVGGTHIRHHRL